MPSWFSNLFRTSASQSLKEVPGPGQSDYIPLSSRPAVGEARSAIPKPPSRRIIKPEVILDSGSKSAWSPGIAIKARVEKGEESCCFLVDRPVLEGLSAWFPAQGSLIQSPLAEKIFSLDSVVCILIHDFTVTVTRHHSIQGSWEELAHTIGSLIREHLLSGQPVISEEFLRSIPPEDEIRIRVQAVIDSEINPGVAAHSGVITLTSVKGNTVTINMGGGCQGCAASTITLKDGIHRAFRHAIPQIGAILDDTDHSSGTNPYYESLPAGMRANA
ncbi:MAG: Fe/S biogenesis protein NfuA [bacterium]|nr:NifU family protein [bacterium]MBV6482629.1 Fe/S biogenesis protein NfuA [bacterium]MCE7908036.1 hypothetical protein [Candidatus Omnitrophica bacterium COP1]